MRKTTLLAVAVTFLCAGTMSAAENPNLAPQAAITASVESVSAAAVADGLMPALGSRDQRNSGWKVKPDALPASLVFTWPEPVTVSTVVYYGRTTWGFEVFKDYAVYLDDASTPVVESAFQNGHGPQLVTLPAPIRARTLRLEFRSRHAGDRPGAAEVQIFAAPPTQEQLLCRFTDLSMDYRYAYYPSHNLVRIHLPQPPADATDWHLTLRPEKGGAVLAERSGKLPTAAGGEALPVPALPEGDYTLTLTLTGGSKPVIEERGIRRDRPEWEGGKLGLEDIVVPPFTPLEVDADGPVVRSVLRVHKHGQAGLWRQVTSQGRELLAAPVRLEVTQGGKVHAAGGGRGRIIKATPTHVSGEAGWTAGPLAGKTRFAYDYDGMMRITFELAPTETEIERVQLVIPLKAAEAWLMHPVTTGLRQHFAGRIPALPEGVNTSATVWTSAKVPDRLNGTFVPYIYVGGPERGICFAADNDRDWIDDSRDRTEPIEIDRDGETVNLRFNLVAVPARLERPRSITFALQATPAKPMPEHPYNWRRWWATGTDGKIEDVGIDLWPSNEYWGGLSHATSIYPAFKDYRFWDQLAQYRQTRKRDPAFEEQWLARFSNKQNYENLKSHFNAGWLWAANSRAITPETRKYSYVIPYTNPRGADGETEGFHTTYLDEWLAGDIADPAWQSRDTSKRPRRAQAAHPGGWNMYEIEPVPSRIDALLFYHKKMLETFADGIYWDNFFLQPNYAPAEAGGPGYVDDEGRPRAGVNLMGFRELVRRTATMMHVMGKRPLTFIHMTNVNLVPMLSFGTATLDWEWRMWGREKDMEVQDRIRLDEIQAQSLGLQSGSLPVAIYGMTIQGAWLFRTLIAVCVPHEIRIFKGYGSPDVSFVQNELARFGYGMPDCRVFRYWDEGFPLKTEGAEIRALVLARNGKAMIALGNFGPANAAATPVEQRQKAASYTVRIQLDLAALKIAETAQAWDVELKAGRKKAENPAAIKPPTQPAATLDLQAGDEIGLELEEKTPGQLNRLAPGVFELEIAHHDFALIVVE